MVYALDQHTVTLSPFLPSVGAQKLCVSAKETKQKELNWLVGLGAAAAAGGGGGGGGGCGGGGGSGADEQQRGHGGAHAQRRSSSQ